MCSKVLLFNRGSEPYSKSSRLGQWGTALATSTPELLCSEAPGLTGFWHQGLWEEWREGCPKGHKEGNCVSLGPYWIGAQEPQWEQEAATSCGLASHAEQEHGEGARPLAWTPTSDFQARSKADHTFYRQWKDIRTFLCTETCSGGTYSPPQAGNRAQVQPGSWGAPRPLQLQGGSAKAPSTTGLSRSLAGCEQIELFVLPCLSLYTSPSPQ